MFFFFNESSKAPTKYSIFTSLRAGGLAMASGVASGEADTNFSPELEVAAPPPHRVSLAPFTPCVSPLPRRLSSSFSVVGKPVSSARKQLAWVSLQGRLVGAAEATSARFVGGGLGLEETAAWELFSPLHRVLIVAVVAVAASESKRSRKIAELQRSVDLRDQILQSMQQKLDDLCLQMSDQMDQPVKSSNDIYHDNDNSFAYALNPKSGVPPLPNIPLNKPKPKDDCTMEFHKDDIFNAIHVNIFDQEERRMSDLSDLCSSVTSAADIQLSNLAIEQDFYNLRNECREKDTTIKELTAAIHASAVTSSKRIMELEEIIKTKAMVISKMKKDMMVLEQQVIHLTRLRRPSFAPSNSNETQLPFLATNILYDMSSTSSSSSDSDSPCKKRVDSLEGSVASLVSSEDAIKETGSHAHSSTNNAMLQKSVDKPRKRLSTSPLKENSLNNSTASPRSRQLGPSSGDFKKTRRRILQESKHSVSQKRWV